jgi:hypothetical protein
MTAGPWTAIGAVSLRWIKLASNRSSTEEPAFPRCNREILGSAADKFPRRPASRLREVQDGDAGAHDGIKGRVEMHQLLGRRVAGARTVAAAQQSPADFDTAEPVGFQCEIGDFVDRVELPQIGAKLQAIDNPRRTVQIDMLRPQITMTLDQAPALDALTEQFGPAAQKPVEPARVARSGIP